MSTKVSNGLDLQNAVISNVATPGASSDAANKQYVDDRFGNLNFKEHARAASTGNVNTASAPSTVDGVALAVGNRVLLKDQTSTLENGVYTWNGAAAAMTRVYDMNAASEFENAVVSVDEGTVNANTEWRCVSYNFVLATDPVTFQSNNTATPQSSETVAGKTELATQGETDTGTDDARAITPLKLTNWSGRVKKSTANIGDGAATQYDLSHNFNTRNVQVEVYRNSTPWDTIVCDVARPDANTVRLNFAVAPTSNQFSVVVWS